MLPLLLSFATLQSCGVGYTSLSFAANRHYLIPALRGGGTLGCGSSSSSTGGGGGRDEVDPESCQLQVLLLSETARLPGGDLI